MSTDAELLQRYVAERDEHAFTELVQRYLGLVYAAASRRANGRAHLAEEVAQKVFSDLARRAPALTGHPALTGWLYRTTRYVAIDAIRAEQRREKLAESLRQMPDDASFVDSSVDWERLRPVIDEALDHLKDNDREILLLRFFNGLSYAAVGQRLALSENAARMRAERALDKLRGFLSQRGVTSTSAALGLLLASPAFAAAPAALVPVVATTALAAASTGATGLAGFLLMNKIALPVVSASLAAGVTVLVWTAVARDNSRTELASLRQEHSRLLAQAPAPAVAAIDTSVKAPAGPSASNIEAIAAAMAERETRLAAAAKAAPASNPATDPAHGHRNRGQATPRDAGYTLAWAGTIGDVEAMSKLVYFDDDARKAALEIIAGLPESVRARYPTPEAFYGFLMALDGALLAPPPRIEALERMESQSEFVEIAPGRVAVRRVGTSQNRQVYQQTDEGWKLVVPKAGVVAMPNNLNGDVLAKFNASKP
ncbi:MAG TPA: sigma-70 family RNA polymerase sigma factor [Candidatus Didemnitutus sp.]|nr:sigma-70 family RNA polymerase sigma factor [Candidatus Didemnitutus sp.]